MVKNKSEKLGEGRGRWKGFSLFNTEQWEKASLMKWHLSRYLKQQRAVWVCGWKSIPGSAKAQRTYLGCVKSRNTSLAETVSERIGDNGVRETVGKLPMEDLEVWSGFCLLSCMRWVIIRKDLRNDTIAQIFKKNHKLLCRSRLCGLGWWGKPVKRLLWKFNWYDYGWHYSNNWDDEKWILNVFWK